MSSLAGGGKENPCKNFAPNIFNKNKCQNCFRPRETHLQSDKDLSKAKPIYCGWLLLAPIGTDFTNPLHKNRKWQRRMFILYEHGALRYQLDDNATTVAQGTIDMNLCTDVIYADEMTNQKHTLCILMPESQRYFVRGECREDIMGWHDTLVVYPDTIKEELRMKKKFKKRRSEVPQNSAQINKPVATSYSAPNTPLGKIKSHTPNSPSPLTKTEEPAKQQQPYAESPRSNLSRNSSTSSYASSASVRSPTSERGGGFASYQIKSPTPHSGKPYRKHEKDYKAIPDPSNREEVRDDGLQPPTAAAGTKLDPSYFTIDRKPASGGDGDSNKSKSDGLPSSLASGKLRRNVSISTSSLDSTNSNQSYGESTDGSQTHASGKKKQFNEYHNLADVPKAKRISSRHYKEQRKELERRSRARSPGRQEVDRIFGRERRRSRVIDQFEVMQADQSNKENNEPEVDPDVAPEPAPPAPTANNLPATTPREGERRGRTISRRSTNMKQGTQTDQQQQQQQQQQQPSRLSGAALRRAKSLDRKAYDSIALSSELFNVKKGWLTIQDAESSQWSKHWFVLGSKLLRYYQDSTSEEISQLQGAIDLQRLVEVKEVDLQRNYGFHVKTDDATHLLAAMTSGIRKNWMRAITTAGLPPPDDPTPKSHDAKRNDVIAKISDEEQKKLDVDEQGVTERSQRRRARIQNRRKEGRARTFDFAEFRPLAEQALGLATSKDDISGSKGRPSNEVKARSRTFDHDTLLSDLKQNNTTRTDSPSAPAKKDSKTAKKRDKTLGNLGGSIENAWKKLEEIDYDAIIVNGDLPARAPRIKETANMVKALQSEVDSLKKQMERVNLERSSSTDESTHTTATDSGTLPPVINAIVDTLSKSGDTTEQKDTTTEEKLKQELAIAQEALRKLSGELRECTMQLDIARSDAQVTETRLDNARDELRLEKSRREEEEKEHRRKESAYKKQIDSGDAELKKTETQLMESQRKIRDLERQISIESDHSKESARLEAHIEKMREHAEKQEREMRELRDSFETKCQLQKQLEDRLSDSNERVSRSEADDSLRVARDSENRLKEQIAKLIAQIKIDDECNESLRDDLTKEQENSKDLKKLLEERDADIQEMEVAMDKIAEKLKSVDVEKMTLLNDCNSYKKKNKKLNDEAQNLNQVNREMRSRLLAAEKLLGDIDDLRNKDKTSVSSFKAKVSELEAEMGDTGQMIAARLSALERPRRDSDSSNTSDKESLSQKNQRLEADLDKRLKKISSLEEKLREMEERELEANQQFTAKLQGLGEKLDSDTKELKNDLSEEKAKSQLLEEKLQETQNCLQHLHQRAAKISSTSFAPDVDCSALLQKVLKDIQRLSAGDTCPLEESTPPRSPSPTGDVERRKFQRITDAESRQQHQKTMSRLRQLTEKLKSSDGKLVSPSASPLSFLGLSVPPQAKSAGGQKSDKPPTPLTSEDVAKLFAKQVSTQALLLAEMAATLRRSQSSPSLTSFGRSQQQNKGRQAATSPQLTSAEFSDTIARHTATGGLLQHVDALAQKLTLEGMLMREVAQLRDAWLQSSRSRAGSVGAASSASSSANQHRSSGGVASSQQQQSDLAGAMVVHSHVSYVLQVYNERISRLSLEARQARHRADAAMRKLRELVDACKTQDLEAVSSLAVQVDTDSIAPPYSDMPPWEQQVDYGTLHGAQSLPSSVATESMFLDQEATFFQHLAEDLRCMSSDVQTLSKLGAQLLNADGAFQRNLQPSEIGEHASTVAKEAVVQAEIIYVSHRLRRDYDEELRKAKAAVLEQASHFDKFKLNAKVSDEKAALRIKQITEEYNSKVERLQQEAAKLEATRAEMANDMEERLTRLSRKHEQEMSSRNAKHEQETSKIRKELATAKSQLEASTRERLEEIEALKQRFKAIDLQHSKEGSEIRDDYERRFEKAKEDWQRDVTNAESAHRAEIRKIKAASSAKLNDCEQTYKETIDKLMKETAKNNDVLASKHKRELDKMEKDHSTALARCQQEARKVEEAMKREADERFEKVESKHKAALKIAKEDAESQSRDTVKSKIAELKKEYEKVLDNRDKLHKEQLEREKKEWSSDLRQQFDQELEAERQRIIAESTPRPLHARSSSVTSETETREALRERITSLEDQIGSMQDQLDDEQRRPSYQQQLRDLKTQCDASFTAIEESHAKQIDEITAAHERTLRAIQEKQYEELNLDKEDTRRAIDAMRKHHQEEVRELQERLSQSGLGDCGHMSNDVERLNRDIETLSEHYSKKCIELAGALEHIEKAEDDVRLVERDNQELKSRNKELSEQLQTGYKQLVEPADKKGDNADSGKLYQLQVTLRVKASEIDYLKQEIRSLKQEIEELYKENKQALRKHQNLFDELTLARSQEAMARREVARLKERHSDEASSSEGEVTSRVGTASGRSPRRSDAGYDFQKSRSQPDIPANPLHQREHPTSSVTSVKRRSSDRSKRNARV